MKYLVKTEGGEDKVLYSVSGNVSLKSDSENISYSTLNGPGNLKNPIVQVTVNEEGEEVKSIVDFNALTELQDGWKSMDTGVVDDAITVFKTKNRESILAFVSSYQLRILAPQKYSALGLVAEFTIGAFTVGDLLNTDEKVKDYYTEILVDLDTKRNTRIVEYLTLKASLGL